MKYIVNEYNLYNPKIHTNIDIVSISDIHSDNYKMEKIKNILRELRITTLLISGDLLDKVDDKRNEKLYEVLRQISLFSNIFISKGNHDQIIFSPSREIIPSSDVDFFNDLDMENNIKVFEKNIEECSLNDNINLSALNISIDWYQNLEDDYEFEKIIMNDIEADLSKFNILLAHSPNGFIKNGIIKNYLNYFKDMNLILCGHMHGGLLPIFFRRIVKHKGIFGPYATTFPNNSYGLYENDNISLLISGGVTKISNSSELRRLSKIVDNMYKSEIELIHLLPGDSHHMELIKRKRI